MLDDEKNLKKAATKHPKTKKNVKSAELKGRIGRFEKTMRMQKVFIKAIQSGR